MDISHILSTKKTALSVKNALIYALVALLLINKERELMHTYKLTDGENNCLNCAKSFFKDNGLNCEDLSKRVDQNGICRLS